MPNETMQDVATHTTCEFCHATLEPWNTYTCDDCVCAIFDRHCEMCSFPVIPDWDGTTRPCGPVPWRRNQTLGEFVARRLEYRPFRTELPTGPLQTFAFPERAFANIVETLRDGHETNSGEFVCDECGFQCDACHDWHFSSWGAEDCCNPDRQCDECGDYSETEEMAEMCCGGRWVHDYSYTPSLQFFSGEDTVRRYATNGVLYLGMELETENAMDHMDQFYADASEDYGDPHFVWAKRDGSLGERGVEFVTMPATLDAFRTHFPFRALERLNANGARSFHTGTCGMHIHVSRSGFVDAPHVWRFVKLQTWNVPMCEMVAQRPSCSWARWTSNGSIEDSDESLPDVIKGKASNHERYVALNFQNSETIELRYFRGNLRTDAIVARLEFVHAMWEYTRGLSVRDVRAGALKAEPFMAWTRANIDQYATFVAFANDRGISCAF